MSYGINTVVGGFKVEVRESERLPWTIARTLREERQIETLLKPPFLGHFNSIAEFGCGYGRMLGIWKKWTGNLVAYERDEDLFKIANEIYPNTVNKIDTLTSIPNATPVDLGITWTVLQHIPPSEIAQVCKEISRLVRWNFLIAEEVDGDNETTWGRTPKEYAKLLSADLVQIVPRYVEGQVRSGMISVMVKSNRC